MPDMSQLEVVVQKDFPKYAFQNWFFIINRLQLFSAPQMARSSHMHREAQAIRYAFLQPYNHACPWRRMLAA